jgi:hypothetical protein
MNLDTAIRKGIFQAINGNVVLNGDAVEVFDAYGTADQDQSKYPYILLNIQTKSQRAGKQRRPMDATIQMDFVTGFLTPEGREDAEDMEEQATLIVCPDNRSDLDIVLDGWSIDDTFILNSTDFAARNNDFYVFRKTVTFGFICSKA